MKTRYKIDSVKSTGTASAIGLQEGDVLLEFNGIEIASNADIDRAIASNSVSAAMHVARGPQRLMFEVPAGSLGINVSEVKFNEEFFDLISEMQLTTAPSLEGYRIVRTIEIVSAECVFGLNIIKDVVMSFTDFFGGRSDTAQSALRDARIRCLVELKKEAALVGANAVIGVDLDYSEFSGKGAGMLFLVATGTAVFVEKIAHTN